MPHENLEQRVAALEKQVAALNAERANGPGKYDWRQTIGMFSDDPEMLDLFAEAMKLRAADRKKVRKQKRSNRRVKS